MTSGGLENRVIRFLIENCLWPYFHEFWLVLSIMAFYLAPEAEKLQTVWSFDMDDSGRRKSKNKPQGVCPI